MAGDEDKRTLSDIEAEYGANHPDQFFGITPLSPRDEIMRAMVKLVARTPTLNQEVAAMMAKAELPRLGELSPLAIGNSAMDARIAAVMEPGETWIHLLNTAMEREVERREALKATGS